MLCFACTGCNALLQASVYFIPNRSHCCTEGIFFLFRVIILREMLMYKSTFCVERYKRQVSRYYSAVDLEIWVLTFLPVYLGKSRDFLSSFKKNLFVCIPVPLCWQKWEGKKIFKLLKEQIYDRQSFSGAWLNSAVAGIVFLGGGGGGSEIKVPFRIALLQVYLQWHSYLTWKTNKKNMRWIFKVVSCCKISNRKVRGRTTKDMAA